MHTIQVDRAKFKLPAGLRDLKLPHWIFWLYLDFQEDLEPIEKRQSFFEHWIENFSRKMKAKVAQLSEVQLWQVLDCLTWLHELEPLAFAPKCRFGRQIYEAIDFKKASIVEFVMADKVFGEIAEKPEKLPELIAILYRPAGEKFDSEKSLARVKLFSKLDKSLQMSVLYWFLGIKRQIRKDYEELFEGASEGDGLGWAGTLLGIAETHVFGNLEETKYANMHEVFLYLVKKHREAERQRKRNEQYARPH